MAQRLEDLLDIVGSQALETPVAGMGMNLTGMPNLDYLQNLANLLQQQQQQGPQLGPDEFGSYSIPASDPTYSSGFDYARSIAGGMPMSQVIAPGVSYSPEQPMGYTQEQLNIPRDVEKLTPPPILPPTREPDDPRYFGTGIGGVNIPVDRDMKMPPLRDIFGANISSLIDLGKINKNLQYMSQKAKEAGITGTGGVDLTGESLRRVYDEGRGLFQNMGNTFKIDQDAIDREVLDRPMISGLENRDFMDADSLITGVPTGRDFSIDREPIPPQDFGYGPGIMPPLPPMDINKLIPPTDLPPINIPPRIPLDLPIVRPPTIMDKPRTIDRQTIMDELTGGRFSINQKRPMGLF